MSSSSSTHALSSVEIGAEPVRALTKRPPSMCCRASASTSVSTVVRSRRRPAGGRRGSSTPEQHVPDTRDEVHLRRPGQGQILQEGRQVAAGGEVHGAAARQGAVEDTAAHDVAHRQEAQRDGGQHALLVVPVRIGRRPATCWRPCSPDRWRPSACPCCPTCRPAVRAGRRRRRRLRASGARPRPSTSASVSTTTGLPASASLALAASNASRWSSTSGRTSNTTRRSGAGPVRISSTASSTKSMLDAISVGSVSATMGCSWATRRAGLQWNADSAQLGQRGVDGGVVDAGEAQDGDAVAGVHGRVVKCAGGLLHTVPQLAVREGVESGQQFGRDAAGRRVGHEVDGALRERRPVRVALHDRADDLRQTQVGIIGRCAHGLTRCGGGKLRIGVVQLGDTLGQPVLLGFGRHVSPLSIGKQNGGASTPRIKLR